MDLAERIAREARQNDAIYAAKPVALLHYGHDYVLSWVLGGLGDVAGRKILDLGVGPGHSSIRLAKLSAHVSGIDVSSVATDHASHLAKSEGLDIPLRVMPGEILDFPDASFDVVLCMSCYYHMDLERAAFEFARGLRRHRSVVMVEPLASNPQAWIYRRLIRPSQREATSEETPLRVRDLQHLRRQFATEQWQGLFLTSLVLFAIDRIAGTISPTFLSFRLTSGPILAELPPE
jgi:SAM-dependent methyltransferase